MFFTDHKTDNLRKAIAQSLVIMAPETLKRVQEKTTPKGDVLELARTAGVFAAKKTPDLLPYCHPIPIDGVTIHFDFPDNQSIRVEATVMSIAKTGVEMEALTAASIASLTIYDMLKPIDKNLEITATKLLSKKGGKSDFREKISPTFRAAIIVTSDGTFEGKREDKSGIIIKKRLEELGIQFPRYHILPDEKQEIQQLLLTLVEEKIDLILTTGGTGLGPRDVTVEATQAIIDREIPGITETMRHFGQRRTPYAMLSRGLAGQKGNSLIINLPGSSKGAKESLDALLPALLHAYPMMKGGGH